MPAGPLYSIADIFADPQYAHRETVVRKAVADRPARRARRTVPALSDTPGEIRWLGPELGDDTDEVLT